MLTIGRLLELAFGADEARKIDTAIPQQVFDAMTPTARADIAGWYYDVNNRTFGRLLTQTECWTVLKARVEHYQLELRMMDHDVSFIAKEWPCLRQHAERGEIQIVESAPASA